MKKINIISALCALMVVTTFSSVFAVRRDGGPDGYGRVGYYNPYGYSSQPYYARPYDPHYGPYAPYGPYYPRPYYSGNPLIDAFTGAAAAIDSAVRD